MDDYSDSTSKLAAEEQLIMLVHGHSLLYDLSSALYKNKDAKLAKWIEISETLGIKDTATQTAVQFCKSLWDSLRNQYTAYLRKLNMPTGSGRTSVPYFRHAEAMRFLSDFVEPRKTYSNVNSPDTGASAPLELNNEDTELIILESEFLEGTDEIQGQDSPVPNLGDDTKSSLPSQYNLSQNSLTCSTKRLTEEVEQTGRQCAKRSPVINPANRGGRGHSSRGHSGRGIGDRKQTPFENALTETLTAVNKNPHDEFELYCLSLAPTLRKVALKHPKRALQVKIKIQEVLLDADSESD